MGELLDALNELDDRDAARDQPGRWAVAQAAERLSRWTRQSPLQALTVAFLLGVLFTRRR
jgi:hypothetical protein